jgi:hypothetical protein
MHANKAKNDYRPHRSHCAAVPQTQAALNGFIPAPALSKLRRVVS